MGRSFAQAFDGNHVEVGGLSFSVTEQSNIEATTLPADGENIFHSHVLARINDLSFSKKNSRVKIGGSEFGRSGYRTNGMSLYAFDNNISPEKEGLMG